MKIAKVFLAAVAILFLTTPAFSAVVVYSGYDVGTSSLGASPNATAAAAAFDGATITSTIDFETWPSAAMSVSGSSSRTNDSGCPPELCGYNTTSGGSYFWLVVGGEATFTFTNPIDAFGAYFTGWQVGQTTFGYYQTLTYTDGSTTILNMPDGSMAGGTVFFGFTDAGASISSIAYYAGNDIVAVDDVRYSSSVPEPATMLLLGIGLMGIAGLKRRSRS